MDLPKHRRRIVHARHIVAPLGVGARVQAVPLGRLHRAPRLEKRPEAANICPHEKRLISRRTSHSRRRLVTPRLGPLFWIHDMSRRISTRIVR